MEVVSSAGALCSTVTDPARWPGLLRSFLDPASYGEMSEPAVLADGTKVPDGLGLQIREFGSHPAVSHGGVVTGFISMVADFPEDDVTVAMLRQQQAAQPGVGGPAGGSGPRCCLRRTSKPVERPPGSTGPWNVKAMAMDKSARRGGIAAMSAGGLVAAALVGPAAAWDGLWLALAPAAALVILAARELHSAWRPRDGRLGAVGSFVLATSAGSLLALIIDRCGRHGITRRGARVAGCRGSRSRGSPSSRAPDCSGWRCFEPERHRGGRRLCSG